MPLLRAMNRTELEFTTFATPIGECAIAWSQRGISGTKLLHARFPGARRAEPPAAVQHALDGIVATLSGQSADFSNVHLDMRGVPKFHQRVYEIARTIPSGTTMTYGEIATRLGDPTASRDVGYALGHNPFPIIVPCHRVLAAGNKMGGFSAPGGVATKIRLLTLEGALLNVFDQR